MRRVGREMSGTPQAEGVLSTSAVRADGRRRRHRRPRSTAATAVESTATPPPGADACGRASVT